MEGSYQDKESGKLSRICKFLQKIYSELQSYGETLKQTKKKEGIVMDRKTLKSIQRIEEQDNKSTGSFSFKERRKI